MVGMLDPSMLDPASLPPYNPLLDETLFSPGAAPPGMLNSLSMMPPGAGLNAQLPPLSPSMVSPAAASSFASAAPNVSPSTSPSQGGQPPVPTTSLLGRILNGVGNFANNNPMTLMALGGGLAGAPSLGTGLSRGFTAAAPALNLDRQRQIQQSMLSSNYSSIFNQLVSNGMPRDQAASRAWGMVTNPEMFKALSASTFGPGNAPSTTDITTPDGINHKATYDPTTRQWKDILTGTPLAGGIGAGAGPNGAAPAVPGQPGAPSAAPSAPPVNAPTPGNNPFGAPVIAQNPGTSGPLGPPPAGANVPKWIEAQTAASAKESAGYRDRATAGIETIQKLGDLENMVRSAPADAFGIVAGTDKGQFLNRVAGAGPGWSPQGASGNELVDWHERLKGAYANALDPISRMIGGGSEGGGQGGIPRNPEVLNQAREIVGGTDTSSKDVAIQRLQDAKVKAYDAITSGIQRGVIDPTQVLQRPKSAAEAQALGRGAVYLAPDGSVRRNPL